MVIGPKDSVAILILKKAEAQITAKKTSKEQSIKLHQIESKPVNGLESNWS